MQLDTDYVRSVAGRTVGAVLKERDEKECWEEMAARLDLTHLVDPERLVTESTRKQWAKYAARLQEAKEAAFAKRQRVLVGGPALIGGHNWESETRRVEAALVVRREEDDLRS